MEHQKNSQSICFQLGKVSYLSIDRGVKQKAVGGSSDGALTTA